jgi:uncharacterized RDD family membrane protein YckC
LETNASQGATARCAECREVFPMDSMIRHRNAYVCVNCKPVFMQKLAEGADLQLGEIRYAGFWIRSGATLLDGFILLFVYGVLFLIWILAVGLPSILQPNLTLSVQLTLQLIVIVIPATYETLMTGRYGATLGKMACRIKVVKMDGGNVSYARALGRYFAKMLNQFTVFIGYIMAAFDTEKRGLHDRICNTRVVFN